MLNKLNENKEIIVIGLVIALFALYIIVYIIGNITYKEVETINIKEEQVQECKVYNSKISLNGKTIEATTNHTAYLFGENETNNLQLIVEQNIFRLNRYTLINKQ